MIPLNDTLRLIARLAERQAPVSPLLDGLFARLARADAAGAEEAEDRIWRLWMDHPNREAAAVLDRATSDIAARRFDIAETRLARLLRTRPDYGEAWHKLATLHYLLGRDTESLAEYHRSLELEPRHFAALCAVGELLADGGEREGARLAFLRALRLHPRLDAARRRLDELDAPSRHG